MKYPIFVLTLLVCIPSFCADEHSIQALMNASQNSLRNMGPREIESAKRKLTTYRDSTREAFLSESLFFGISRRILNNGLCILSYGLVPGGAAYDAAADRYNLNQEITSGIREADTTSTNNENILSNLPHYVMRFAGALVLSKLANLITEQPVEWRLKVLEEARRNK